MNKEKIIFKGYEVRQFSLDKECDIDDKQKGFLTLKKAITSIKRGKEELDCVVLRLVMYTDNSKIDITVNGYFEIPKSVDDDLKNSFLKISAPAIIYPYVRTFISEITAFDSGETVILPIINFAEFNSDNED